METNVNRNPILQPIQIQSIKDNTITHNDDDGGKIHHDSSNHENSNEEDIQFITVFPKLFTKEIVLLLITELNKILLLESSVIYK